MAIVVIGLNYKTAPITLREKVYFSVDKLALYLQDIIGHGLAHEAVLLSTCNRSELYCDTDSLDAVCDWFCTQTSSPKDVVEQALYVYRDEQAIAHIMAVACGLDSMVLGEPQILGQMKEAFSESCSAGAVGALFHRLFQQVFTTAKEIRTTTEVGACPVSVASAAVHFAKQQLPDFENAHVALIGAGETTALIMRYLMKQLSAPVSLINRRPENAAELAQEFGAQVYGLDALQDRLVCADVVFSATRSATPVVNHACMQAVMRRREAGRPIMLIDIAVPRDIDLAVVSLPNVQLYCVDDLKHMIEKNRKGRAHAAEKANEMIRQRCQDFFLGLQSLDKVAHTIRAYRGQVEALCRLELGKAQQQLYQGADPQQVLEAFAHAFINKLMHEPSVQLRQAGAEGRFELLRFAKQLFALPDSLPSIEPELEHS